MLRALTHRPSTQLQQCELTYLSPTTIDIPLSLEQHEGYCAALRKQGVEVEVLDGNDAYPDCAFVEDCAVVLPDAAIITPMGTASRAREPAYIASQLRRYREQVHFIEPPASLEGGDVLRVGNQLYVGESSRTDAAGISQLSDLVKPYGFSVQAVPVRGCLHLKTGCTALPDGRLLINSDWIDATGLPAEQVQVPASEPWGANLLLIRETVLLADHFPQTLEWIAGEGFAATTLPLSEFAKAEAGVTCLSLLLEG